MDADKIQRINTLYHKEKAVGLTDAEKAEQAMLRKEYINAFKRNLTSQLDTIKIKNQDGTVIDVKKRHEEHMKELHRGQHGN